MCTQKAHTFLITYKELLCHNWSTLKPNTLPVKCCNITWTVRNYDSFKITKITHKCSNSWKCQSCCSSGFPSCLSVLSFVQPAESAQTEMQGVHRGQANNKSIQAPTASSLVHLSHSCLGLLLGSKLGRQQRPLARIWHCQSTSHHHLQPACFNITNPTEQYNLNRASEFISICVSTSFQSASVRFTEVISSRQRLLTDSVSVFKHQKAKSTAINFSWYLFNFTTPVQIADLDHHGCQ